MAQASAEMLDELLRSEGLFFGDRPLCSVLRPRFLTVEQYRLVARASALVGGAFEAVRKAAMGDAALRAQFGLLGWEEALIHADPGFAVASPTSRLDAFFAEGKDGLKFTEYNAETPAGGAYNDALSRVFLALPAMHAFSRSHIAVPLPVAPSIIHAILNAFHSWRGVREKPVVCILDWAEVPTRSEFVLFEREFAALGIEAFIGDPREATFEGGRFRVGGREANLIYKRVLIDELVRELGISSPVVNAVRAGAVCMVNPFRCKMLHKKASLAVVSDERQAPLLSRDQQAAVKAHVPWTRVVEERKTEHAGKQVDLIDFTSTNRERLVLKPNDEYGCKGIVLGWTVDDSAWHAAVRTALAEPYIVQERVEIPSEGWPAMTGGALHIGERMLDTAPFLADGTVMTGCLTRIATDPLLNVTAGGGSNVPTFLVEAR
ncbi:MAG: hypothetical protein ABIW79_00805 [Gemmatimonas sp.]